MCDNVKEKNPKKAFILIARDFFYVRKMKKIAKNNRNIASNKSLNHNIYTGFFFAIFLCSHIGYHPQEEEFVKFIYKSERKVKF
jgi:hypothetical protein